MQIHELNNYSGSLGDAYLAADNGSDTGKMKTTALTDPLNARIDNIIAGPAPSAAEIVDARLGADGVTYPSLGAAIRDQVTDLKSDLDGLYRVVKSKNLFDISKVTTGFLLSDGKISVDAAYANYVTSDFIEIEAGESYTCSYVDIDGSILYINRIVACLYDSSKQLISETYKNINEIGFVTVSNPNAKYIRTSSLERLSNSFQIEKGATYSGYVQYSEKKEILIHDDLKLDVNQGEENQGKILKVKTDGEIGLFDDVTENRLYRKTWYHCGDSFSDYTDAVFESGRFKDKYKSYPRLIAERCGMEIDETFFASGRTLAYPEVSGGFTNSLTCPTANCYYQNIPEDADYITIMLGINDGHHRSESSGGDGEDNTGVIPLGTIDDTTVYTYYGAWNVVLTWLLEHRPFTHIGILISNGVDTVEYMDAQIAVARKYGIPFINLNGDDRTPVMIRSQNQAIPTFVKNIILEKQAIDFDGTKTGTRNTHPNAKTHEFESWFIESFIRSL